MNPVEAAVVAARRRGIRVDEPRVLKDRHNLVVHLAPSPVVARVAQKMSWMTFLHGRPPRLEPMLEWLRRDAP